MADFATAIEIDPKFVVAYSNRGIVYYNLKYYGKAYSDFIMAITFD